MSEFGRAISRMGMADEDSPNECCGMSKPIQEVRSKPTLSGTLEARKARLQAQLADVEEAITAVKENPGVEKVLNLLTKANF